MRDEYAIPPLRDLPGDRLAERKNHLAAEIARRPALPHRRGLVLVAAAALLVAVGTASAIGSVRDVIFDLRFPGLPPKGAPPSAPQRGELVAQWGGFSATLHPGQGGPLVRAWLYSDGRLIWDRPSHGQPSELTSGLLEQRLSPKGVELVRSAIAGLFRRSRTLLETVPSDDDRPTGRSALFVPPDYGSTWGSVQVPDGDRVVRLQWRGYEGTLATPEQLSDLRQVDALFTDPTSVLPASAWADREVRTYVASHYAVCITPSRPKKMSLPRLLSLLPPRAADLLRDRSRTRSTSVLGAPLSYCSKLTTEEAREVNKALSGLERESGSRGGIGPEYRVPGAGFFTRIWLAPYFPDGQFIYSGGYG